MDLNHGLQNVRVSRSYLLGLTNEPFKKRKPSPPPKRRSTFSQILDPGAYLEWIASDGRKGKLSAAQRLILAGQPATAANLADFVAAQAQKKTASTTGPGKLASAVVPAVPGNTLSSAQKDYGDQLLTGVWNAFQGSAAVQGGSSGWTKEQDDELTRRKTQNETWAQIVEAMGKSKEDLQARFKEIKPADWKPNNAKGGKQSNEKNKGGNKKNQQDKRNEENKDGGGWGADTGFAAGGNGDNADWAAGGFGGDWDTAGDAGKEAAGGVTQGQEQGAGNDNGWYQQIGNYWNRRANKILNQAGNGWGQEIGNNWGQKDDNHGGDNAGSWDTNAGQGDAGGDAAGEDAWGANQSWGNNGNEGGGQASNGTKGWGDNQQDWGDSKSQKSATKSHKDDKKSSHSKKHHSHHDQKGRRHHKHKSDHVDKDDNTGGDWNGNNTSWNHDKGNDRGSTSKKGNEHHKSKGRRSDRGGKSENSSGSSSASSTTVNMNDVYPDSTFSLNDLTCLSRLLKRDYEQTWFRLSCAFKDKTGRYVPPEVFQKKLMGNRASSVRQSARDV